MIGYQPWRRIRCHEIPRLSRRAALLPTPLATRSKSSTWPFLPNQRMMFVKTFKWLHSVRKVTQHGSSALRKTVTIVIEKGD
jgi:hypothetical protein